MFVLRLVIVVVCAIMLLPMEPTANQAQGSQDFCQRYPKTCDASVELWTAFKLKLAYGIKLARRELGIQTHLPAYSAQKLSGRLNEWRPSHAAPRYSGVPDNTLGPSERQPVWR